jgi:hypothetical protein
MAVFRDDDPRSDGKDGGPPGDRLGDRMDDGMGLDGLWIETPGGGFAPAHEHLMDQQEEEDGDGGQEQRG